MTNQTNSADLKRRIHACADRHGVDLRATRREHLHRQYRKNIRRGYGHATQALKGYQAEIAKVRASLGPFS